MTVPDPPPTVNTMRTIGIVWIVVGAVAVVVGAVATVFAVVLFGILAAVLGIGLYAVQQVRATSAERSARTLSNSPPPPASAPFAGAPAPADDEDEYEAELEDDDPDDGAVDDGEPHDDAEVVEEDRTGEEDPPKRT